MMMRYFRVGFAGVLTAAALLAALALPARADFDLGFGQLIEAGSPIPYATKPFPLEEVPQPPPARPYTAYVPPAGDSRLQLKVPAQD